MRPVQKFVGVLVGIIAASSSVTPVTHRSRARSKPLRGGRRDQTALSHRRQRRAGDPAARLRADQPYVAPAHRRARQDAHGDRARPARLRRFGQAGGRLRQEDDGAGHPRARAHRSGTSASASGPRHRADGRLRLRRAVSRPKWTHRADGRLPSGRRRLDERLAAAGTSGTSTSTARRRWRSSTAASASTSSTSGTTSPPIRRIPSPRRTGSSTRRHMRSPAPCGPASRCSAPSSRTPRTSPHSPRPN